jgi:hypothetical protein
MNQSPSPPIFIVGFSIVVFASYFAGWTLGDDRTISLVPTVLCLVGFLLVLPGQVWFLGAFIEKPEVNLAGAFMIALFGLAPATVVLMQTWTTPYRVMMWTAMIDLALVGLALVLPLVVALVDLLLPESYREWRKAKAVEEAEAEREKWKNRLPG